MARLKFYPQNPAKYAGDISKIVARSKWELIYMDALDRNPIVLKWVSEPKNLNISYRSPLDRKTHKYWPDFIIQYVNGAIDVVEIKPLKEALAEKAQSSYDKIVLLKNAAKWAAAEAFAKSIGARFRVVCEDQLFKRPSTLGTVRSRGGKRRIKGI